MRLVWWLLGWTLDIISAIIIAGRERRGGFFRHFWYELRARRGLIPYNEPY